MVPLNQRTMTVKLRRIDVCDLLIACSIMETSVDYGKKWKILHDVLLEQLDAFDAKVMANEKR